MPTTPPVYSGAFWDLIVHFLFIIGTGILVLAIFEAVFFYLLYRIRNRRRRQSLMESPKFDTGEKVYVAPNGNTKLKIYPHGYIEHVGDIDDDMGEMIHEMSLIARDRLTEELGRKPTPFEVFEVMGWKKEATV